MSTVWCAGAGSVESGLLSVGSVIDPNLGQGDGVVLCGVGDLAGELVPRLNHARHIYSLKTLLGDA